MAVQTEIWLPAIEENLYKGFELLRNVARDDSSFVNNKTVHVPNAAAAPVVSRGNTTYPVSVVERADTDVNYDLANFEIGPVRLGWADGLQLSYDKVSSVVNDFMGNLSEHMQKYVCSQWWEYNASTLVSTSSSTTVDNWLGGTAAGSLKVLTGLEVRKAAEILDKDKFPVTDRYLLLDYKMFWQLITDLGYNANRLEVVAGLPAILTDKVYGFTVIQLPFVAAVTANTSTSNMIVPDAADGTFSFTTNHRPIGLAFHKSAVGFAWTPPKMFSAASEPTMFGDIMSASVYGGGKYRRGDAKGVVAIRATS